MNAFQSQADVVIQKSTREGFGLTVSEALWKARPFIGGDVGGIPLQVQDGETGFLVSLPEECADRSLRILREPDLGKRLGPQRQGARAPELPHAPPASRLAAYLQRAMTSDTPLVLVSNRGPATFERAEDGSIAPRAGRRRPGHRAHGAGAPPRGGVGGVRDDRRGPRDQPPAGGGSFEMELDEAQLPAAAGGERPRGLRPLLQRRGQPDAVVHPALPLGPLERPGHPPARDRRPTRRATAG